MRAKIVLLAIALCSVVWFNQFSSARSMNLVGNYITRDSTNALNMREFKVHMDSRSLWSTGTTSQAEMVSAAQSAGYNALFFADNALFFAPAQILVNPDFEEANASGVPLGWEVGTISPEGNNIMAIATANVNDSKFVRSGYGSSLHLAVQNTSNGTMEGGYAYAKSVFERPSLNQSSPLPTRPLLVTGLTFSIYVYVEHLGALEIEGSKIAIRKDVAFVDNGWFYVRFIFGTPTSPHDLRVTLVYEDHPIDSAFLEITSSRNQTYDKVILVGQPLRDRWFQVKTNVTDLALRLWNQTVAEDWRLDSVEVGTRSRNNLPTSVYVDDASLSPSLDYFKSIMEGNLSSGNFAVYPAYSIDLPNEPRLLVYGTNYIPQNQIYDLTDPTVWKSIDDTVAMHDGMVVLGPVSTAGLGRYVTQNGAFGVSIMDGTTFHGLEAAGQLLDQGRPIFFIATGEASSPTDYNSSKTWATHVFAENDSQVAILDAIAKGRAYIAASNFGGTFSTEAYGFSLGPSPVYIPYGENASLTVSFTGLTPGRIMLFDGPTVALKVDHNGEASTLLTTPLSEPISHLFVAVTTGNNSMSLVTNPTTFVQTSLLPGGALFMDNDRWTLQSSNWMTTFNEQQRLKVVASGPAGSDATLYLYSSEYRPDAKSQDRIARFITVDNATLDPMSSYDVSMSVFVLHLHSNGGPIEIVFNFDVPLNLYIYSLLSSTLLLSLAVIVPFVVASLYLVISRHRKRSKPSPT